MQYLHEKTTLPFPQLVMAANAEKYPCIENPRGGETPGQDHASAFALIRSDGPGRAVETGQPKPDGRNRAAGAGKQVRIPCA